MFWWIANSDDGCFSDLSSRSFDTQEECYNDMMLAATEKMRWNIEYSDVCEDCEVYEEEGIMKTAGRLRVDGENTGDNWAVGYRLECHPHMIQHYSYSGLYTYLIVNDNEEQK